MQSVAATYKKKRATHYVCERARQRERACARQKGCSGLLTFIMLAATLYCRVEYLRTKTKTGRAESEFLGASKGWSFKDVNTNSLKKMEKAEY
jgi:hypothetical protein